MGKYDFVIVGAGLAGCECALCLADSGYKVLLCEQKPIYRSQAHASDDLAELVCSNSLRSNELESGPGLLKNEMRLLGSPLLAEADKSAVPAGKSLAVDRTLFSRAVSARIWAHPGIDLLPERIDTIDSERLWQPGVKGVIIAAGPLASDGLAQSLATLIGAEHHYFYDAIAPIVWTDSLNMDIIFRASRNQEDDTPGDYLNCPMNREEYMRFYQALSQGEVFQSHGEETAHFEGCMPIEALAARGERTLAFGPLRPVGLVDPRDQRRPWAVLQLRQENRSASACNLVGCQTKLLQKEQERIFRLVPGLENVEFARYGSMHRNTYINAPIALNERMETRKRPGLYLAGQITGVEGYVESIASGLWLARQLAASARGRDIGLPPVESALGALLGHLRTPARNFQPSNIHFGLMPGFEMKLRKKERRKMYAQRGVLAFAEWLKSQQEALNLGCAG